MTSHRVPALLAAAGLIAATQLGGPGATAAAAEQQCQPGSDATSIETPWPQQVLASDQVWPLTRGAGVTVAVLDTGVSNSAPALAGRVDAGTDVTKSGSADNDCNGHGTFVAGLVAAGAVPGSGFSGIAPEARIFPVRVSDKYSDVAPDTLARGIDAAVDHGASVIVTAISAPALSPALQQAVTRAQQAGALVVAPAGMQTYQQGDVPEPAALPGVLSVAAMSRTGAAVDTRQSVANPSLCAPGSELTSIAPTGRGTVTGSGSALAVGYAGGVAALVRAYRPELTADMVRERLIDTADAVAAGTSAAAVGHGLVNPVSAVTSIPAAQDPRTPALPAGVPLVITPPPAPDQAAEEQTLLWTLSTVGGAVLLAVLAVVIVRGRGRGWNATPEPDRGQS